MFVIFVGIDQQKLLGGVYVSQRWPYGYSMGLRANPLPPRKVNKVLTNFVIEETIIEVSGKLAWERFKTIR